MIRLDDLTLFCRVAALGSFTAAANEADLVAAQVSVAVRRLEEELGIQLLTRSTRSIGLTEEGQRYLPLAEEILRKIQNSAASLTSTDEDVEGELHLSVPSDLGRNVVVPWLSAFRSSHPGIRMRVSVSDTNLDVFRDPVDAAIRYGNSPDSSYVAMPLVPGNRRVLVAAPSYVARHGSPAAVEELPAHSCLAYMVAGRPYDRWRFAPGTAPGVDVNPQRISDDGDMVRRWAVAGEGIAYKSWLDVAANVKSGELVVLLPDAASEPAPLSIVCAHRRQFSPTVRRLYAWLGERFAAYLDRHPLPQGAIPP
jgi:DNA-binding transcriptional LysR family regulator